MNCSLNLCPHCRFMIEVPLTQGVSIDGDHNAAIPKSSDIR
jgi:hypothetical protein